MLILASVGRERAQSWKCLRANFKRFLASKVHQSIKNEIQILVELILRNSLRLLILPILSLLFCENFVMGDQERDGRGTLRFDFVRNLSCTIHKSANDAFEILNQVFVIQQDVVFERPEGRLLILRLVWEGES